MGKQMKSSLGGKKLAQKGKPAKFQFDNFPESLVFMILQFLPLKDAARASCVDQNWLHAWRFYPNLEFTTKSFGLKKRAHTTKRKAKFVRCVNALIRNHAGTGVKSFTIKHNLNNQKYAHYLDRWIYFAVSSGAKELTLDLIPRYHPHHRDIQYSFPSSNFAAPEHTSIEHLNLCFCYLTPSPTFIGLSNLKTLDLSYVRIASEDLESLLRYTLALEQLKLKFCPGLDYLKISDVPCKLNYIDARYCWLKAVEIGVQNPVTFNYCGRANVKIVPSGASMLKEANFELTTGDIAEFAISELAPHVPNLETLFLIGYIKMVIPVRDPSNRFRCLKHLQLQMMTRPKGYDLLCLVSFLDAAPFLEALTVHLNTTMVFLREEELRRLEKREPHKCLRFAKMTGFPADQSSLELALHILENSTALECLTLDPRLDTSVWRYSTDMMTSSRLVSFDLAISRFIRKAVPWHVKLSFPCSLDVVAARLEVATRLGIEPHVLLRCSQLGSI